MQRASPKERVAVVHNVKNYDLSWLKPYMHVEEVGKPGNPFNIGESRDWLNWISNNYDTLPEYVAFLHGHKESWHSNHDPTKLAEMKPENVQMLASGSCVWKMDMPHDIMAGPDMLNEAVPLNIIYPSLFGMGFEKAYGEWGMGANYVCCAEHVVSRAAIKKVPHDVYRSLAEKIDAVPHRGWGAAMERTWQNIYTRDIVPSASKLVQNATAELLSEHSALLEGSRDKAARRVGNERETNEKNEKNEKHEDTENEAKKFGGRMDVSCRPHWDH